MKLNRRVIFWKTLKTMGRCTIQAFLHPRTPITCVGNPVTIQDSPLPWWGCVSLIIIGIVTGVLAEKWDIQALTEFSRASFWGPFTLLFGKGTGISRQIKDSHRG